METSQVSINRWMNKEDMVCMYTMEYYLAFKKKEVLSFLTTWMNPKGIVLSKNKPEKTNATWCHLCTCACMHRTVWLCDPVDCSPPGSSVHGVFPDKNTGVGCHFFLQGTFPTQGSNPHLLCLLHWQVGSLQLSNLRSPAITYMRNLKKKKKKAELTETVEKWFPRDWAGVTG